MGGRYLITGSQIGVVKHFLQSKPEAHKLIDEIVDNQFIWNSQEHIDNDIKKVIRMVNKDG